MNFRSEELNLPTEAEELATRPYYHDAVTASMGADMASPRRSQYDVAGGVIEGAGELATSGLLESTQEISGEVGAEGMGAVAVGAVTEAAGTAVCDAAAEAVGGTISEAVGEVVGTIIGSIFEGL